MGSSPPLAVSIPSVLSESNLSVPYIQDSSCNDTTVRYPPGVAHYVLKDSAFIIMGCLISLFTVRGWPLSPRAGVTCKLHPFF